jgi:hypothetical protein
MRKQILAAAACLGLGGAALAEEAKLETIPWTDVPKVYAATDKTQKPAEATVTPAWKKGDRWAVEVYRKDFSKKTSVVPWVPTPQRFTFEVTGTEVREGEEVIRIQLTSEDGGKTTLLINGVTHAVVALVQGEKETPVARPQDIPTPWEIPTGKLAGRAFESPLGVPCDAVIFSEGVVGFPATDVPKSSGKVVDVDGKTAAGEEVFQRWDTAFPQFPLCSYSLDRAVLLREVTRG